MSDLWSEASYDLDAERRQRSLEMAKAASEGTWAFLSLAQSPEEYADRVALSADRIQATASAAGVEVEDLVGVFDQRFALLMEASDNPFAKDDSDDSDSDDKNGDGEPDDSDADEDSDDTGDGDDEDSDDDGGDGADDTDQQTDKDDDGDTDNADDDSAGKDEDPDQDEDEAKGKSEGISPWASSRYASLAARIAAGENPLSWGGTPFVGSPARKHAADGAEQVSDVNTPTPPAPNPAPTVPGMEGGIAETTKPRQLPEGGGMDPSMSPGMGMDGITPDPTDAAPTDPEMNGGDIEQGADTLPPAESSLRQHKVAAIAAEVRRYNPMLSQERCRKVAAQVYDQYLSKHAEDMNPLFFGDRGDTPDGPITHGLKHWSPEDVKRPKSDDGEGGETGGGGGLPSLPGGPSPKSLMPGAGGAGEIAGGAGPVAGGGAAAEELLPLLML